MVLILNEHFFSIDKELRPFYDIEFLHYLYNLLQRCHYNTTVSKSIDFLRVWLFRPPDAIYPGLGTNTQNMKE